jgi:hypothetical protein
VTAAPLAGGGPVRHLGCPVGPQPELATASELAVGHLAGGEGSRRPVRFPLVCPAAEGAADGGLGRRRGPPAETAGGLLILAGQVSRDAGARVAAEDDNAVSDGAVLTLRLSPQSAAQKSGRRCWPVREPEPEPRTGREECFGIRAAWASRRRPTTNPPLASAANAAASAPSAASWSGPGGPAGPLPAADGWRGAADLDWDAADDAAVAVAAGWE